MPLIFSSSPLLKLDKPLAISFPSSSLHCMRSPRLKEPSISKIPTGKRLFPFSIRALDAPLSITALPATEPKEAIQSFLD